MESTELLIKKVALKEVELWLYQQYAEIDAKLAEIEKEK